MENNRMYLALDPGKSGAVAILNEDGSLVKVSDIPLVGKEYDLRAINALILEYPIHFAVIEKQHMFGREGINSAFNFGIGYGILLMALEANNVPYQEILPQAWKKAFSLINKNKASSVRQAQKMYPGGVFVGPRGGLYDGRAEACLIAEYGRRLNKNIESNAIGID